MSSQNALFDKLMKEGKNLAADGKFSESLRKFELAKTIQETPTVLQRIQRLKDYIEEHNSSKTRLTFDYDKSCLAGESSLEALVSESKTPAIKIEQLVNSHSELISKSDFKDPDASRKFQNKTNEDGDCIDRKLATDPEMLDPENLANYKNLYKKSAKDAAEGRLQEALVALETAFSICRSEKVKNRIKVLKDFIKKSKVENDQMVAIADGFEVHQEIYEQLYPYQRLGVAWMWNLFQKRKGGVLGDDMGLGKTCQVIAFLSGLIKAELIKSVLIIMPVSLLTNWENEFKKWCPKIKVFCFHGTAKKERERNALKVQQSGHVLLTSYGMVVSNLDTLDKADGLRFIWDYIILDEGHKIKNLNKTTKAVHEIPARNRLVLTGTPIQNNLRELWALFDFAHQGALLGSMKTFKMRYENIITRSREKDATVGEKCLGTEMAENLKKLIQPYFLRRSKLEIWGDSNGTASIDHIECKVSDMNISEDKKLSTRKNDLIVWLCMSDQQCEIYKNFLDSDAVKTILISKRSPLVELTTLKKICDHPRLLSQRACLQLGLNGELEEEDLLRVLDNEETIASSIENVSDETLINESVKMKFLINLLENLKLNGHRTLVFSLSRKILDMVHRILTNRLVE